MPKQLERLADDHEYRVAIRLLDQEPAFDREILEALVGGRKRYSDLKPLLHGRNNNVLTKALARLRDEGVLQSGLTQDLQDKTYALTTLGVLAVFRMHEMIPYHRSKEAVQRGRAAVASA